ncbi:MAG: ATP-binding cassette domain-containing protein [Chitinivibrionales bacterium]|nr:ATP-binding cassette domain-containing protein [Chitinivibrionales bacterium]
MNEYQFQHRGQNQNQHQYCVQIAADTRTIVSIENYVEFPQDITFLFGESGIGKSMIAKSVYGILDASELAVSVNGMGYQKFLEQPRTQQIRKSGFFVFQEPSSHLNPLMRLSEQLREGSLVSQEGELDILKFLWQTADERTLRSILQVYPKPFRPSGGEKQRILLAMAFKKIESYVRLPPLAAVETMFVFDEPTGSLDNAYRNLVLQWLLKKYATKRFGVLFITHDYSIISQIYKYHQLFLPRMHFLELYRSDGTKVSLREFSPQSYFNWISHQTPVHRSVPKNDEPVVQIDSEFSIFNRTFGIFQDNSHSRPAKLVIHKGEMVYVKAPSGAGKTTLAKIAMGLFKPQRFTMTLGTRRITEKTAQRYWQQAIWGRTATMAFQHADEALNVQSKVRELFLGLPGIGTRDPKKITAFLQLFFDMEITDAFLSKKIATLSGGQKQRLNVLRAMILDTDLLILDEPLNGLDFETMKKVLRVIVEKQAQSKAILIISHNEEIFESMIDRESIYYLQSLEVTSFNKGFRKV